MLAAFGANDETPMQIGDWFVSNYPVITNGNGSTALKFGSSNVLHRCQNMFGSSKMSYSIHRTSSLDEKVEALKNAMTKHKEELTTFFEELNRFQRVQISAQAIEDAKRMLLNIEKQEKLDDLSTRKLNLYNDLGDCITREINEVGQNAFGLWNGVTFYTTHLKQSSETMALMGSAAVMNENALDFCRNIGSN